MGPRFVLKYELEHFWTFFYAHSGTRAEWSKLSNNLSCDRGDPGSNPSKGWRTKWKPYYLLPHIAINSYGFGERCKNLEHTYIKHFTQHSWWIFFYTMMLKALILTIFTFLSPRLYQKHKNTLFFKFTKFERHSLRVSYFTVFVKFMQIFLMKPIVSHLNTFPSIKPIGTFWTCIISQFGELHHSFGLVFTLRVASTLHATLYFIRSAPKSKKWDCDISGRS